MLLLRCICILFFCIKSVTTQSNVPTGVIPETFHEIVGFKQERLCYFHICRTLHPMINDRAGYDIPFNNIDNIHTRIELKSTHGNSKNAFNFTSNELKALKKTESNSSLNYRIYRLYRVGPLGVVLIIIQLCISMFMMNNKLKS